MGRKVGNGRRNKDNFPPDRSHDLYPSPTVCEKNNSHLFHFTQPAKNYSLFCKRDNLSEYVTCCTGPVTSFYESSCRQLATCTVLYCTVICCCKLCLNLFYFYIRSHRREYWMHWSLHESYKNVPRLFRSKQWSSVLWGRIGRDVYMEIYDFGETASL